MGMGRRRCPVCDALVGETVYAAHQAAHRTSSSEATVDDARPPAEARDTRTLSSEERAYREEQRRSDRDAEELDRNRARRAASKRATPTLPELNLTVGERVRSSLSGDGLVTEIAEAGAVQRVWVQFDNGKRGKLFARALERI
jgi:hypothetical protein